MILEQKNDLYISAHQIPIMKELTFYLTDADKINKKYGGKHIAIVEDKVVASGSDPKEVWESAKKKCPGKRPVLGTCQEKIHWCSSLVEFAYRKEKSGLLGDILRPVAQLEIGTEKCDWFPVIMYIDSGADISLVPRNFGALLGLTLLPAWGKSEA